MLFNEAGVLADEVVLQILHRPQQGAFLVFQGALPHAGQAGVGFQLDEYEIGAVDVDNKCFDLGDFHGVDVLLAE